MYLNRFPICCQLERDTRCLNLNVYFLLQDLCVMMSEQLFVITIDMMIMVLCCFVISISAAIVCHKYWLHWWHVLMNCCLLVTNDEGKKWKVAEFHTQNMKPLWDCWHVYMQESPYFHTHSCYQMVLDIVEIQKNVCTRDHFDIHQEWQMLPSRTCDSIMTSQQASKRCF